MTLMRSAKGIGSVKNISATKARFIKLGPKSSWEKDCIKQVILMLGYHELLHELALSGEWEKARQSFPLIDDPRTITCHIDQVRNFYEEPASRLWITFYANCLWWCFDAPGVTCNEHLTKTQNY